MAAGPRVAAADARFAAPRKKTKQKAQLRCVFRPACPIALK
jgi:hypothetical protein